MKYFLTKIVLRYGVLLKYFFLYLICIPKKGIQILYICDSILKTLRSIRFESRIIKLVILKRTRG